MQADARIRSRPVLPLACLLIYNYNGLPCLCPYEMAIKAHASVTFLKGRIRASFLGVMDLEHELRQRHEAAGALRL